MPFEVRFTPRTLRSIQKHLDHVKGPGSGRLANNLRYLLYEGNEADRLRGVGASGQPLRKVQIPRRGRYAGYTGPPLAPRGRESGSIADFEARIYNQGQGWKITAGNFGPRAQILRWHAQGRSGTGRKGEVTGIRRNVLGISPFTRRMLLDEFRTFARMKGAYR